MSPNARLAIFVAASAFFVFGPIAATSKKRPWLPMRWRMYQGVGVNYCQAQVHAVRDGARVDFPQGALVRAVGRGVVRTRHRAERFVLAKKAREHDIVLASEGELASVVKTLCEAEPDVHAAMRCAPAYPGGKWRAVEDGAANLCQRTQWSPPSEPQPSEPAPSEPPPSEPQPSEPPPSEPPPSFDPETGEEIEPEAAEP